MNALNACACSHVHTTRDSTKYTRCARSFRQYHGQRILHAIVMTDALNIHEGILKLKLLSPYLLPAVNQNELQYASPDASCPP